MVHVIIVSNRNVLFKELLEKHPRAIKLIIANERSELRISFERRSTAEKAKSAGATDVELAETILLTAALRAGGAMTHGTHTLE